MTKDSDERNFIDYISWDATVRITGMDDDEYPGYLANISTILRRGLAKTNAGVLEKYLWIYDQYIQAIVKFEELKAGHPYRLDNPDNYEAVVSLPKLEAEARRAREIVAAAPPK